MGRAGILLIARLRQRDSAGFVGDSPPTGQGHATDPVQNGFIRPPDQNGRAPHVAAATKCCILSSDTKWAALHERLARSQKNCTRKNVLVKNVNRHESPHLLAAGATECSSCRYSGDAKCFSYMALFEAAMRRGVERWRLCRQT